MSASLSSVRGVVCVLSAKFVHAQTRVLVSSWISDVHTKVSAPSFGGPVSVN